MKKEFDLYKILFKLEQIVRKYPEGEKKALSWIQDLQQRLATRRYRVAVIGEFNRGKSSLINALLGAQVLPTNILPTTAIVNRIRFGETYQAVLRYNDGRREEVPLERLAEYGTKTDEERAAIASTILEMDIEYPAVFCQNSIEILDTPGMNDDAQMAQRTLGVLGEVDSAIMVIHAEYPMSQSEKNLVLMLIAQRNIHHVSFVVTFIDHFEEKEEQDRAIETVRKRIQKDTWELFEEKYGDNPALLEKGRYILQSPVIWGVSSKLAFEGFVTGSKKRLAQSRFPALKEELLAFLTAGQSTDTELEIRDCASQVYKELPAWNQAVLETLEHKLERNDAITKYCEKSGHQLQQELVRMEEFLKKAGFAERNEQWPQALEAQMKSCFIGQLATIREDDFCIDTVQEKLFLGKERADHIVEETAKNVLKEQIRCRMGDAEQAFFSWQREIFSDVTAPDISWSSEIVSFPAFQWRKNPIPDAEEVDSLLDPMPHICFEIQKSLEHYRCAIQQFITDWRRALLQYNTAVTENFRKQLLDSKEREQLEFQISSMKNTVQRDMDTVQALGYMQGN